MKSVLVTKTSDNTKFYSYKKAEAVFATLKAKPLSLRDLVLILLHAQNKPIHGRILLMKELFLLYQEVLSQKTEDPKFVPYRFGPYSFHLTEVVSTLFYDGLIEVRGKKNSKTESFIITEKGNKQIRPLFNQFSSQVKETIKENRKGWDQLGIHGILNYVYTKYRKYKKKSLIKNRYKDIDWGHATG